MQKFAINGHSDPTQTQRTSFVREGESKPITGGKGEGALFQMSGGLYAFKILYAKILNSYITVSDKISCKTEHVLMFLTVGILEYWVKFISQRIKVYMDGMCPFVWIYYISRYFKTKFQCTQSDFKLSRKTLQNIKEYHCRYLC